MCLHFNGNKSGHSISLMHGFKCFVLEELLKASIRQWMMGKTAGLHLRLGSAADFVDELG